MITTPHTRPFKYPIIQEYTALGLDPTKIELLCLFDPAGNLHDASSNKRHGDITVSSGFSSMGRYGTGMYFDVVDDIVIFGDVLNFSPATTPFSISLWYIHAVGQVETIIAKRAAGIGWRIFTLAEDFLRFEIDDTLANEIQSNTDNVIPTGIYSHFVFTYDGSQNGSGIIIYINGKSVAVTPATIGVVNDISNAGSLRVSPRNASMDNLMIYSDVLSSTQIQNMCNAGL